MWPPVTTSTWAVLLCVFLAALPAHSERKVYGMVGGEVVLDPGVAGPITSITWKDGMNFAVDWDGTTVVRNRHFKVRGNLNSSTGEMTLTGLERGDSVLYTPNINGVKRDPIRLIVIFPVPVPTIIQSCDDEKTSCTLTCDGNTTGAEPVTYTWILGDKELNETPKERQITKEDSLNITDFTCELKNPVSQESSENVPNPLITTPEGKLKISTGLTVFISLLAIVIVIVLLHRWKAGTCFFQKDSMPWEADFWRKEERQSRGAVEVNGSTARPERTPTDEETPMA